MVRAMSGARTRITTARLQLLAPDPAPAAGQVAAVVDFFARNQAHLSPWDPPPAPGDQTPEGVLGRLNTGAAAFGASQAWRWWLAPRAQAAGAPLRIIGSIGLSNLSRGASQSCSLGYSLDESAQGQGLMHEALQAVIAEAFGPAINLHRLQAGVQPNNPRSLAVLARLGFVDEGLARDYLYINGAWRDHRIFSLSNPAFVAPAHW